MSKTRFILTALAVVIGLGVSLAAKTKFSSVWKAPDAGMVSFADKKVAALVIDKDDSLRVAGEEALARELSARGMQGVATYRIAPKEELQSADRAKPWFERAAVEGVVAVRPVSADTQMTYTPGTWLSSTYASFWSYYGYGWSSVYIPPRQERETVVVVESTIYSIPRNQLLWAAVTESTNPKDLPRFVEELVKKSVEALHEQGLARGVQR